MVKMGQARAEELVMESFKQLSAMDNLIVQLSISLTTIFFFVLVGGMPNFAANVRGWRQMQARK